MLIVVLSFFFFSSRRRHTRFKCDWSSDVCSSDLPFLKKLLDGGKLVRYGAKSLPYGGWYAMPRNYLDGGLIIGDSGSFLDSQRLKGIHLAMKSGMLAAETIFEALKSSDTSARTLSVFPKKIEQSYIKKELRQGRNVLSSFYQCSYPRFFSH